MWMYDRPGSRVLKMLDTTPSTSHLTTVCSMCVCLILQRFPLHPFALLQTFQQESKIHVLEIVRRFFLLCIHLHTYYESVNYYIFIISTLFLVCIYHGSPRPSKDWSFGWSLYRILPPKLSNCCFWTSWFCIFSYHCITCPSIEALRIIFLPNTTTFAPPKWSLTSYTAREHFRQPIVDYINPECLVSKSIETRRSKTAKCPENTRKVSVKRFWGA